MTRRSHITLFNSGGDFVPDVTAPTLSNPNNGTETSDGTTDASVDTNEGNGTLYWAVLTDGGSCTDAQLKAGSGGNIVAGKAGNQAVSGTGTQVISNITGLSSSTDYEIVWLHRDAAGNDSSQATVGLTTAAGGGGMTVTSHLNEKIADTTGPLSVTSGSFTPADNSLLVVCVEAIVRANEIDTANSSVSGGGLTWTKRTANTDSTGFLGFSYSRVLEVWTAPVTTGASMAITYDNTVTSFLADGVVALKAISVTGYDTGAPITQTIDSSDNTAWGTDGSVSLTLGSAPASSSVVLAFRSFEADEATDVTATPGADFTEVSDNATLSGHAGEACVQAQKRTGSTSTTINWVDVNVEGAAHFASAAAAIEIKAA